MNETQQAAQATTQPPASTGARIVAALIDIVVLAVIFVGFAAAFGTSETSNDDESAGFNFSLEGGPAAIYFLVVIGYYWLMEAMTGKTFGKILLGLKVVSVDGGSYGLMKAFVRNLLRIVDALPALYLLGFIVMLVTKRKQRIGDLAAGTVVVRA